jgi:hypothetical protein
MGRGQTDTMKPTKTPLNASSLFATMKTVMLASLFIGAVQTASGEIVYKTSFDKPFVAGLALAGQLGWDAPPPLSPNAAVITDDKPQIGKQTVEVRGADLVPQALVKQLSGGYYDAIGSYRQTVNFETCGSQLVTVSAMVRVDGEKTATGDNFFSAGIAVRALLADGDDAGVGEIAISSDGRVYGYSGNQFAPTFLTNKPITLGKWHRLSVKVDFERQRFALEVDGEFQGDFPFPINLDDNGNVIAYTNVLRRGSLLAYATPDTGVLKKADYSARYDHFSIKASGAAAK